MHRNASSEIRSYYHALHRAFGPQHWWPGRTRFEVIVGAYLVQNTAWANVDRALRQLRAANALTPAAIRNLPLPRLEFLVRPAGYFRQKSRSLKIFVRFLDRVYGGSLSRMFAQPTAKLRSELLSLRGVGPETADSILLYAGQHPVFVVDTYARRIFGRHHITDTGNSYEEVRSLLEKALATAKAAPSSRTIDGRAHQPTPMSRARRAPVVQTYNEMHGLLVATGKAYCLKQRPNCDSCPLRRYLPT